MVKLSIVIPVYNGENTITRCLDSIWSSGLVSADYEVICVNDCSTDNTLAVLNDMQRSHGNLKVISNEVNVRAGGSRNHGVREAVGEYITFIDADDYYDQESLKHALNAIFTDNLDILFCDSCRELEGGKPSEMIHRIKDTKIQSGVEFMEHNHLPLAPWKYIFKKSLMTENNIWFEECITAEDGDWVCRITIAAKRMRYLPILLIHYVLMPDSLTAKVSFKSAIDVLKESKRVSELYKTYKIERLAIIANGLANDGTKRYLLCYAPINVKNYNLSSYLSGGGGKLYKFSTIC